MKPFNQVRKYGQQVAIRSSIAVMTLMPLLARAVDPTTPEEAISGAKTTVLALLALGGAAIVAIALAMVGWAVGAKFVKKLKGAA